MKILNVVLAVSIVFSGSSVFAHLGDATDIDSMQDMASNSWDVSPRDYSGEFKGTGNVQLSISKVEGNTTTVYHPEVHKKAAGQFRAEQLMTEGFTVEINELSEL